MISQGDRVYLKNKIQGKDNFYRNVRAVVTGGIKIYYSGQMKIVPLEDVIKLVRESAKIEGITDLSKKMYNKGIRNEDLSEKSGYSVGTVDRARRGVRVKQITLQDLIDSAEQM